MVGMAAGVWGLLGGLLLALVLWGYGLRWLSPPAAILGGFAFLRALLIRFELNSDYVLVRNYFRTLIVPWFEIDRIGWRKFNIFGPPGASPSAPALAIKRRDGKIVVASATAGLSGKAGAALVDAVHDLAADYGILVQVTAADLSPRRGVSRNDPIR
jgi:hypothetical protein